MWTSYMDIKPSFEKLTEKAINQTEHKHHEYTIFDKTQINLGKIDHFYTQEKKFVSGSQEPLHGVIWNLKRS